MRLSTLLLLLLLLIAEDDVRFRTGLRGRVCARCRVYRQAGMHAGRW
jgi:hypothetical protein